LIATQTLNSGGASPELIFQNLPSSSIYVHAALYSGLNGSGSQTGSLDTTISGSAASALQTALAQPVTQLTVEPNTAAVSKGGSEQFVATAADSSGQLVFLAGSPTWSITPSNPSVAVISSTGDVTGVGGGEVTVQAVAAGQTATASLSVNAVSSGTWTIFVFLNSANDLDSFSFPNINQMEQIAQTANSQVRFVIQWKLVDGLGTDQPQHTFNGTRRYVVVQNGLQLVQDLGQGVDMGSPATLQQFLAWGTANFPAQHYVLDMWDHGNGWESMVRPDFVPAYRGISYDEQTGNHIDVWQLPAALQGTHLDILTFDACLMQMLEVSDEIVGEANYMVCAEDNQPGPGYPYNTTFGEFFTSPSESTTTLAQSMVDNFMSFYLVDPEYNTGPLSQSVINVSKVPAVVSAVGAFSQSLVSAGSTIGPVTSAVRNASLCYDTPDGYFYYDLEAIAQRYASSTSSPAAVKTAANGVISAVNNAVVYSRANSISSDSHGISIEFGDYSEFVGYVSQYANLNVAKQTDWPTFLASSTTNP
jgi:hypothetical protein